MKTDRSFGKRLREVSSYGSRSGAWTYRQALPVYERLGRFHEHRLEASVIELKDDEIEHAERQALREYFNKFGAACRHGSTEDDMP